MRIKALKNRLISAAAAALTLACPPAHASESELAQTYELRGFFGTPENLEVSLRKPGTDKSQWVRVGEKTDGMLVEKADAKAGTATLRANGATYQLRLQGVSSACAEPAAKPAVPDAETPKKAPAKMDAARREELTKKFETLFGSLTPSQNDAMWTATRGKFEALEKEHPEWKDGTPNNPEEMEKAIKAITPLFREGLEAAAKVPGKDGKELIVPDDLDDMLRAALQSEAEKAEKAKAKAETQK